MGSQTPARQIAGLILLFLFIGAAMASFVAAGGRTQLSLQICGFTLGLCVLVLIVGGLAVGSNRES